MAEKPNKARGLGRGLSALMSDVANPSSNATQDTQRKPDQLLPIERLRPNPKQPRRSFDPDQLSELAASISAKGIIQPLIVRPDPADPTVFEIVAGERRWRAAQIAQLHEVPVLVRNFDDTEVLEVAIIENIQRADLNPVDEATGYRQLMETFGHTQDQVAEALGKSRSHIANLLRLLTLPDAVQTYLTEGKLTAGHARALVGHDDALDLAKKIMAGGLSVRATEALVRKPAKPGQRKPRSSVRKDADTIVLEQEMAAQLGMRVSINHPEGQSGGSLIIEYRDLEQLDDLLRKLSGD